MWGDGPFRGVVSGGTEGDKEGAGSRTVAKTTTSRGSHNNSIDK